MIDMDVDANIERGESILKQCFEEGRDLTFVERQWFKATLGYNDLEISRERRRVNKVARNLDIIGNRKHREALWKECDRCEAAVSGANSRGEELRVQIEKQTKELKRLESDALRSKQRVSEVKNAMRDLRQFAPPFVVERYNIEKRALNGSLRRELLDVEGEIRRADAVEVWTKQKAFDSIRLEQRVEEAAGYGPFLQRTDAGKLQITPEWTRYVADIRSQLSSLTEKRDKLQVEYDEKHEGLRSILDYYVERAG